MRRLKNSLKKSDDRYLRVERGRERKQETITNKKTKSGIYQVKIILKHIFGLAEWQENAPYSLGSTITKKNKHR